MKFECVYSEPITSTGAPPGSDKKEVWNFRRVNCEFTEKIDINPIPIEVEITEPSKEFFLIGDRSFYLDRTLSYGDILIVAILVYLFVLLFYNLIKRLFFLN